MTQPSERSRGPRPDARPAAPHGSSGPPDDPGLLLEARDLSKRYTAWKTPSDRLSAPLLRGLGRSSLLPGFLRRRLRGVVDERAPAFYALRDISLEVRQGESLGIIGRNGSGKSTLLQIIAGTLMPTTGSVRIRGVITALLELGSGFNPEFTGRENVLLQGSIYGISRNEMVRRFPQVEAFAEIGEFIDQPVKRYSSGMMLRLAFATQTVLEPDILIVDEALAVGDVFFQAKCSRYFREQLDRGMSLILVSHDLNTVKALCQNTLVLNEGKPVFYGDSVRAASIYHELNQGRIPTFKPRQRQAPPDWQALQRRNWKSDDEIGSREAEIIHCQALNESGETTHEFAVGERIVIRCFVEAHADVPGLICYFQVVDRHSRVVCGATAINLDTPPAHLQAGDRGWFDITLAGRLGGGDYLVDAGIGLGDRGDGAPEHHVHRVGGITTFSVRHTAWRPTFHGVADLGVRLEYRDAASSATPGAPGADS